MLPTIVNIQSHRYSPSGIEEIDIPVSAERHVSFLLNGRPYLSVACSGADLEHLAAGHLVSEGIILSKNEVDRIEVDEASLSVNVITAPGADIFGRLIRIRTLVSGCAGGNPGTIAGEPGMREMPHLDPRVIFSSMKEFLSLSAAYRLTHGVHSGALYDTNGNRLAFYDEIGRHNAVDKLLGLAVMQGIDLTHAVLLSTGRISSEIVVKAFAAKIPVIVTRAAPTSMAVEMARSLNIVLITGVKKDSFYIHHGVDCFELSNS